MAKNIIEVTDETFDQEVLKVSGPVLVDFWAAWCGPCKMLAPTLERIAAEKTGAVKVCKVNIDDNPETPTKYHIQSIPTLLLFKNGQVVNQRIGNVPKEDIANMLESSN